MGWCSGSYLANDVWINVEKYIPDEQKQTVAKMLINLFKNEDADCWDSDLEIVEASKKEN